jgi:hypothetical protein
LGAVTLKDRASEPVRLRSTWATDSAAPIKHTEDERGMGPSDEERGLEGTGGERDKGQTL